MIKKLSEKARSILDRITDLLAGVGGAFLIIMMLLICYQVVMRYLFARPPAWAVEISQYMIFVLTFLAAPWLLKIRGHVSVDIVLRQLNPKAQNLLNMVTSIIGMLISLIIAWYGAESAWRHFQEGIPVIEILRIPKAPLLAFIPLGCFLLSMEFLRQTYGYLKNLRAIVKKQQEL